MVYQVDEQFVHNSGIILMYIEFNSDAENITKRRKILPNQTPFDQNETSF